MRSQYLLSVGADVCLKGRDVWRCAIFEYFQKMGMGNSPLAGLAALGLGGLNTGNTGGLNPAGNCDS